MGTKRLEAFCDGVMAIIITIMVLELKVPEEPTLAGLKPLLPLFISYIVSFIYLAAYWNNHHQIMHVVSEVNGSILWTNLHLLFWLSLFPFATAWMGQHHEAAIPTAVYGGVLLMAGVAWSIMQMSIIRAQGEGSPLARAIGGDIKGKFSVVLYAAGIGLAFVSTWAADASFVTVALMWMIPDRRIERFVEAGAPTG
jgi:uncharacterized membrane protein